MFIGLRPPNMALRPERYVLFGARAINISLLRSTCATKGTPFQAEHHSYLSAVKGSTFVARRAGT